MKKISTLFILNLLLIGGLFGCGGNTPEPAEETTTSEEVTETDSADSEATEEAAEAEETTEQAEVSAPEEGWKKFEKLFLNI